MIVFDIGGGSTEIAWLDGPATNMLVDPCGRIRAWDSLPVGVVTLAERHGGVQVTPESFRGMVEEVTERLVNFNLAASGSGEGANFHLLGTSGTVTTVGGIHLGLAALRPAPGRRDVDAERRNHRRARSACCIRITTSAPPIRASGASVPIWFWPAAPFWKRSGWRFPRIACGSRIAGCAKEF